MIVAV
jgi:hypothetical protein